MKTAQPKLMSLLAVAVLCICVSALAAEHDYYGTLHYPKALVPGVGLDTVEQEGGPDATGYQRRTVQWWPRQGQDVVDVPNVCVDTSGGDPESGVVELAVERLGAGRVVFGSDAPIRHFGVCLAKVLGANLPWETKRMILWDNLQKRLPEWVRTEVVS